MDELVELIVEKTGIPKATAEQVVEVVLDFLKKKLPEPLGSTLENILDNDGSSDMLGGLMGMLGGKK
ncbi:MAG: HU family DNA-binding protein [Anaerolineales bacterium]|nr:HU family DNA-binding protein [Anaerolineales bacterium]